MKAHDYYPGLKKFKIYPEDIAGMIGLPHVGRVIYVDPTNGNDTANAGAQQNDALKTVAAAYSDITASQHDVVIIAPEGGTGRTAETSAITWGKRFSHLIGNAAPIAQNIRAGMTFGSGGSLTVSEHGCIFRNLTFTSSTDIDETVSVTSNRNAWSNIDFKGTSNATSADSAPWRALNLQGEENYFSSCTFGADTMTRNAANAALEMEGGATRNVFDACRFVMHADGTTPVHVLSTGTSGLDRFQEFRDCLFYAFWTNNVDAIDGAFDLSAQSGTAHIMMTGNNVSYGADDWENSASGRMFFPPHSDGTDQTLVGLAVTQTT